MRKKIFVLEWGGIKGSKILNSEKLFVLEIFWKSDAEC